MLIDIAKHSQTVRSLFLFISIRACSLPESFSGESKMEIRK